MARDRLQKILAQAGLGSRRACEAMIEAGRVSVNGQVASLGMKADPTQDRITLDGRSLGEAEDATYILLNKPPGVLSSLRSQGGLPTVLDLLDSDVRVYPVGRLDKDSEGLMLLTNDGELANQLSHPRYGHEKEYRVLLDRAPSAAALERWQQGVTLPDGFTTSPARVWRAAGEGRGAWLGIVLTEGHKRQLRETARVLGLRVRRLIRIRMDSLELEDLEPGSWRFLTQGEIARLRANLKPSGKSADTARSDYNKRPKSSRN